MWVMDEKDERFDEGACGEAERRRLVERTRQYARSDVRGLLSKADATGGQLNYGRDAK